MAVSKPKTHRKTQGKGTTVSKGATRKTARKPTEKKSIWREIYGVLMAVLSVMLLLALVSHSPSDAASNWIGRVGNFAAEGFFFVFGVGAFVTVFVTGAVALWLLRGGRQIFRAGSLFGALLFLLSVTALLAVLFPRAKAWGVALGGWLGTSIGGAVTGVFGSAGAVLVLVAASIVASILVTRASFVDITGRMLRRLRSMTGAWRVGEGLRSFFDGLRSFVAAIFTRRPTREAPPLEDGYDVDEDEEYYEDDAAFDAPLVSAPEAASSRLQTLEESAAEVAVEQAVSSRAVESVGADAPQTATPVPVREAQVPIAKSPVPTMSSKARAEEASEVSAANPAIPSSAEELGVAARARQAIEQFRRGERGPARASAPSVEVDTGEHTAASLPNDGLSLADAERVRASMHHPIDNPMDSTTRQNEPLRPAQPMVNTFGNVVAPPPAPLPRSSNGAFAASIPSSDAASLSTAPPPTFGAFGSAGSSAPAMERPEVEEASAWENARPEASARPEFVPSPPVQAAAHARIEIDLGVEDVEAELGDREEQMADEPLIRRAAESSALDVSDAVDVEDEGEEFSSATAPHKIVWSEDALPVQDRTTRPLDPLDDDLDFDVDPDIDVSKEALAPAAATGPQIIESVAQKERMTCEKMDRALRSLRAQRAEADWDLPPLDFLHYEESNTEIDEEGLREMAALLVDALNDYKVGGRVIGICPGPVVTRFEFEPDAGTKIARISGLATDIAMRMRAENVRIIAPIPGKGCVGVEIPNDFRETVYLKEILADRRFQESRSKLTMALGKDIEGFPVVADLAKMPHLLVAGTTGSGKSVSVNAMITSVLYNASPEEVRLILIDPKQLEFALYEDVPHLLLPVVTDPNKAATALQWAVDDMERRYRLMRELRVRNIEGYNQKLKQLQQEVLDEQAGRGKASAFAVRALSEEDMDGRPRHRHMPYIIVVVDEFADLMMAAGKDVEIAVARLAQKARAAGIHCILATQRPSVDVLTGTIKSNFPTRISFRLISGTDSRTVIDTNGAEHLLGMGDMLYRPPGSSDLVRVHGAFVDEDEIERVVEFLKDQRDVEYDETILSAQVSMEDEDEELDAKFEEAVEVILDAGFASISMIQRRLSIGYNRAANIVEEMERRGMIGPSSGGASRREVLIAR